jgi:hypothetical protein
MSMEAESINTSALREKRTVAASWVECTRKADNTRIYLNMDAVRWLRWDEAGKFTIIAWSSGPKNAIRILESPSELLKSA